MSPKFDSSSSKKEKVLLINRLSSMVLIICWDTPGVLLAKERPIGRLFPEYVLTPDDTTFTIEFCLFRERLLARLWVRVNAFSGIIGATGFFLAGVSCLWASGENTNEELGDWLASFLLIRLEVLLAGDKLLLFNVALVITFKFSSFSTLNSGFCGSELFSEFSNKTLALFCILVLNESGLSSLLWQTG
ncbi:hypothetical protein BpHYR1_045598 [Brachionus plicatilis]|uniref:Uncharacterized protein n=1 Tax=Brachionus plicatilis TaxID=10195 RepID=A0A3M7S6J6_BRAPC|nr:hypothetical protein BpHYR1_045598 [Brachionus plicatilis]